MRQQESRDQRLPARMVLVRVRTLSKQGAQDQRLPALGRCIYSELDLTVATRRFVEHLCRPGPKKWRNILSNYLRGSSGPMLVGGQLMTMARVITATFCLFLLIGAAQPAYGQAGPARAVARGAAASAKKSMAKVLRLDRIRDARTPVSRLARQRTTFRYATPNQARMEVRRGIAPGSHFTSRATRGRPLSAPAAAARYGLPAGKTTRLTVTLPAGTRVRFNKALRGGRGVGELTSADRVDPSAVRRVVRLSSK